MTNSINAQMFNACATVAEVKTIYLQIAMENHSNIDQMTMINLWYRTELENRNGEVSQGEDGENHEYFYKEETELAVIGIVAKVLNAGILSDTVKAYIVGTWIWIMGDTKPIKDKLGKNGLGARLSKERSCWYFNPNPNRRTFRRKGSLAGIAAQYGASALVNRESAA